MITGDPTVALMPMPKQRLSAADLPHGTATR